ncbi:Amidase signature (AS) enzyme [Glarea lozoyensis ATCC 20868]|uniref:Amidase signature (AS) enzyme n=1 Tax=Glarea lozoyensis (strain ATCC 20868 / MF5171) TaxID=1116229 RepID=S3D1V0_GLAL2|nr:Amidase signature (AS) enzyme [Glarea lozoyensis ATCC 20868]EPE32537.1 Amidase signature (AS) enzyme [Glarea lozoyensis ATCC 20868]
MRLTLSTATPDDVEQIADLHLKSFDSNSLLHVQFPTPEALESLRGVLRREMLDIVMAKQQGKTILVVRDPDANNQIISFAKWDVPSISSGDEKEEVVGGERVKRGRNDDEVGWHEDVEREFLVGYHERAEEAMRRVLGEEGGRCYRLTFVGTHPDFQRRGAATILLEWGLSRAEKENVPVYLESTLSAASIYRRHGFIVVDGLALPLPTKENSTTPEFYQELCMLRTWDAVEDELGLGHWDSSLNMTSLALDYEAGIRPQQVIEAIYERIDAYTQIQPSVWIHLQPIGAVLAAAHALQIRWPDPESRPPLWGVPFSVKDSIDIAGLPTTVGCPALAYNPEVSAPVYQHCIDAGALFIGKTNMEQLATGMTGCRSPYGTLHSTFSDAHIVSGSSSGSAVSVSAQLVSFSLGSDTAGSIRIPALYNGVVGFKPTKGTISARGVYPACRHQDCVAFLASTVEDAERVWNVCKKYDRHDHFSKPPTLGSTPSSARKCRIGIPPDEILKTCSPVYQKTFRRLIQSLPYPTFTLDWTPFAQANELLYNGTFVLERLTIFPDGWFESNKHHLHPVTRQVFEEAAARKSSAVDVFRDLHTQAQLKREVEDALSLDRDTGTLSVMIVPTAPYHPTIKQVEADPLGVNHQLGAFAMFGNVLDLCGVAVPCGTYRTGGRESKKLEGNESREEVFESRERDCGKTELPFGVTVLAGSGFDRELLELVRGLEEVFMDLEDE